VARGIPGGRARWIEVEDEAGQLLAGLPLIERSRWGLKQIVSGGSGLYGGPVVDPSSSGAVDLLASEFERSGGLRTVQRELVWAGREMPAVAWTGMRRLPTSVIRLRIEGDFDEGYEASLRRARRKERRRLLRSGFGVQLEDPDRFLESFHEIYAERCRDWGSRPVPLHTLRELFACGDEWLAFVARSSDGQILGAHLCIDLGDELFAWLGTTRRVEGGSLATLLVEAELRWCHTQGRSLLNLGTSGELGGVSEFKRGISAEDDPRWIVRWQRGRGYR
jgi:hypothetical protein